MGRVLTNNVSLQYAVEESLGTLNGTQATGVLTFSGNAADTETVTINTKVYTFKTSITTANGDVLVGATAADSISNLANAINLGPGSGTAYGSLTSLNADVTAVAGAATLTVTAITGGTAANAYATIETGTVIAWADTTLLGGLNPVWKQLEPNSINSWGAVVARTPRNPISKKRQRRKGANTDLDSGVEFEADLTLDSFEDFAGGFVMAAWVGARTYVPSACDVDSFTVTANGAALAEWDLVYVQGALNTANNGLHVVDAGATTTDITVKETLVAETLPSGAVLELTGIRAATGDLEVNAAGNLASTVLDFTTLPLTVGQFIHVGGELAANQFNVVNNTGRARVTAIAANELALDKTLQAFGLDDGAGKDIDLRFGRFLRNVSVDDGDYSETSVQFEAGFPNLMAGGATGFEYAKGNYPNQIQFNLPLTDKASVTAGFIGTDTDAATITRKSGAATPKTPLKTTAFNTSADLIRLRITEVDETGLTTDFKNAQVTLNNNASGEKVLNTLGPKYINVGNFEVDIEAQLLFTSADVVARIRDNVTVTMDFALTNDNGTIIVDVPSVTLGGGNREFPLNESVLISVTVQAFEDPVLGTSIGISTIPHIPVT